MTLTIRRAQGGVDLDQLLALRHDAERWLRSRGVQQWTEDYAQHARGVLMEAVSQGSAWIVNDDHGYAVATVTIAGPDKDFWQPADDPDDALYVYKMITARTISGRGVGDLMLNFAGQLAIMAGKSWLRLDCRRDNHGLHRYYLDRGFQHVRTVWPPPRRTMSGALFQRPAEMTTDPHTTVSLVTSPDDAMA